MSTAIKLASLILYVKLPSRIGLHKYLPNHPGWKELKDELNKNTKE